MKCRSARSAPSVPVVFAGFGRLRRVHYWYQLISHVALSNARSRRILAGTVSTRAMVLPVQHIEELHRRFLERAQLDKASPLPLYFQIKQLVLRHIGELRDGDPIPPEQRISEALDVSRPTVRQAIAELVQEGLLMRTAGKGTFVTSRKIRREISRTFERFDVEMQLHGHTARTEVLDLRRDVADPETSVQFGIDEGDPVYRLERRRFTDGESLLYVISMIPASLVPNLERYRDRLVALRHTLETVYGHRLVRAIRRLEATTADVDHAAFLDVSEGSPVQFVETHVYSAAELCIEYSRSWYRGDRTSFYVTVDRDNLIHI
ncbi:MAG: GntR family transcriptional regulator [Spirochaetota bacterium]